MYNYPEIFDSIYYNDTDHAIMKAVDLHIQSLPLMQLEFTNEHGFRAKFDWRIRIEKSYYDKENIYPPNYVYDVGQNFYEKAEDFKANCEQKGLVFKAICCETYPTSSGLVQESSLFAIYYDIDSSIINIVKKLRMENFLDKIACALNSAFPDHSFLFAEMTTQGPSS